ncbi:siderophore-interacting protein [Cellulosimicrobium arenosum]|uniref:Siderophore-interacting protein n=1 Tax=Cellulosimicrobium arenosum TaxID=2708133 RepID=A0A927J0X6_9MICO|nr:siderophore-interacting protein [Cellulosimicrobium arenosum]MBD8079825.1 siderophore-interacting protein [Cellulosimicrobium arenosum]
MSTPTVQAPRRSRPQIVLDVVETTWLTPHMVRVVAGGPGFAAFTDNASTDAYVKIFFAKPELGLEPPYDVAALRETLPPADLPVTRTYTVRWVDVAAQQLAIDFVVHGDEGLAGPWAAAAQPGDRLVLAGPGGMYAPDPTADWHLLAGDDAAIPAIAAALEAMPRDAVGQVFVEIGTEADAQPLEAPAGFTVTWLLRGEAHAGTTTLLPDAVHGTEWLDGRVQVFAHGEREAMKALRRVFADRGVPRDDLSLSGYWALGRAEDRFQAEKREPIGQIFED